MARENYTLVHAQHAVAGDIGVEFLDRDRMRYHEGGRSIVFTVETYIARDAAPDGVVVRCDDCPQWTDHERLTADEFERIMVELQKAAVPLRTTFRWPTR